MKFSEHHIQEFEQYGIIKLEQFIPSELAEAARHTALQRLTERGLYKNGNWNLSQYRDLPPPKINKAMLKILGTSSTYTDLITNGILEIMKTLIHEPPIPLLKTQLMCSVKSADHWAIPSGGWHLDLLGIPNQGIPGIQMFTFIHDVSPTGGGTLVVAGSHRLLDALPTFEAQEAKKYVKQLPFFRNLMSKTYLNRSEFMKAGHIIGGVPVKVIEMIGVPGDVYIVDMRLWHTVAPNALETPRLMMSQRFGTAKTMNEIEQLKLAYLMNQS